MRPARDYIVAALRSIRTSGAGVADKICAEVLRRRRRYSAGVIPVARRNARVKLACDEKRPFKADVRKLKELGLTESLRVGYRLSPRGRAYRAWRRG